jgi:hypothetical protein
MCTINLKEMMINRIYPEAGAALYAEFCQHRESYSLEVKGGC